MAKGLFIGLATLDVIQLVDAVPAANQKIVARDFTIAAGGPATNAAIAFAHGYSATAIGEDYPELLRTDDAVMVARVSQDPIGTLITKDVVAHGVETAFVPHTSGTSSTVATILVTQATGDRAVVSAGDQRGGTTDDAGTTGSSRLPAIDWHSIGIVETDGYETDLTLQVLKEARSRGIITVFDGGSVKPYTEQLLPYIDVAIVSEPFAQGRTPAELFSYLNNFGIRYAAITRGASPIDYWAHGNTGQIMPPSVKAVDTLGAGDFFHGGFSKALAGKQLSPETFTAALRAGAQVAALSVQSFGTRSWLQ
ncbi:MAG: sugar kinase [Actinomycetaceae bacterium]|nr:sugar kinase [Actinomycetaceae bacterium]